MMTTTLQRWIAPAVLALALTGCANITKVGPGETVVAQKVAVTMDDAWNQLPNIGTPAHTTTWTIDGVTLDRLQFHIGLKDGELLAPNPPGAKEMRPLAFRAAMQPHEIVGLFQGLATRDGSTFTLDRLEPAPFLGGAGVRFEYTVLRKFDEVRLAGVGWAVVRDGQLHAMTYSAPRLGFFARHRAKVEAIARAAKLRA